METTKRSQKIKITRKSANRSALQTAAGAASRARSARARAEARIALAGTKQKLTSAYGQTASALNHTYGKVVDYGKEHPGPTSLIAFGAGVGIGLLVAQEMGQRHRTRRILPPVISALSEIATQLFR